MITLRDNYASECKQDPELMKAINNAVKSHTSDMTYRNIDTRVPLTEVKISTSDLTPNGEDYIHAVEAIRDKKNIVIRIITNANRGANVVIPFYNDMILYQKYRDVRLLIRNNHTVYLTFPELYVKAIEKVHGLYLLAKDFKVVTPKNDEPEAISHEDIKPEPTIYI